MDNITQALYDTEIQDLATDIVAEMMDEHDNDRTNAEDFTHDRLHEVIDGHEWIIYTFYNAQVMQFTASDEAYKEIYCNEDLGQLVADKGIEGFTLMAAFFAMYQDVSELLDDAFDSYCEALQAPPESAVAVDPNILDDGDYKHDNAKDKLIEDKS